MAIRLGACVQDRTKRCGAVSVLACALGLAVGSTPARADDAAARARAEQLYRGGDRAFKVGQYKDAAEAFEQSYAALPLPDIAFAAAQAYRLLFAVETEVDYARRAVELYKLYVKAQGKGGRIPEAAEYISTLEPAVARAGASAAPTIRVARTLLQVSSPVDGAIGTVGTQHGPLPITAEVPAGEYVITVEAPGYEPRTKKATAIEGQLMPVEVELEAKPAVLALAVEAGATIIIDGRAAGEAPAAAALTLPAGRHLVGITRRGRVGMTYEVELQRGETRDLAVDLRPTGQRRAVPWVMGGAGVLALVSGVAGLAARSAQADAQALAAKFDAGGGTPDELDRYNTLRGRRDDRVLATWIVGGMAVGTAITGALLYLLDSSPPGSPIVERAPAPVVTPVLGADSAGLVVQGGF